MKRSALPVCNERGIALVAALVIMALLIVLGTIALNSTVSELQVAGNDKVNRLAFYDAESGLEYAKTKILKKYLELDAANHANFVNNFAGDSGATPAIPAFAFDPTPIGFSFSLTPMKITDIYNSLAVGDGTVSKPYLFGVKSTGIGPSSQGRKVVQAIISLVSPIKYGAFGDVEVNFGTNADVYGDVASTVAVITDSNFDSTNPPIADADIDPDPFDLNNASSELSGKFTDVVANNNNGSIGGLTSLNNNNVTLTAGDYYFTSIDNGNIIIDTKNGPVNIYLNGAMTVVNPSVFKQINSGPPETPASPADFAIYSKSSSNIVFKNNQIFNGFIYAPFADVEFWNNGVVTGAVWASSVTVKNNIDLSFDDNLKKKNSKIKVMSWQEL